MLLLVFCGVGSVCLALCALYLASRLPGSTIVVGDAECTAGLAQAAAVKLPGYPKLAARKVLVTNGCGFLGRHLVEALLTVDGVDEVVVFDEVKSWDNTRVTFLQQSLARKEEIMSALEGVKAVFHVPRDATATKHGKDLRKATLAHTKNLLEACSTMGVQRLVVIVNGDIAFGGTPLAGADESTPAPSAFLSAHHKTLSLVEAAVLAAGKSRGLRTASLRVHGVFGPRSGLVTQLATRAKAGKPFDVVGNGRNVVDATYVGNAVHAAMCALQSLNAADASEVAKVSGEAFFVSNGEPVPQVDFWATLLTGLKYTPTFKRRAFLPRLLLSMVLHKPMLALTGSPSALNPVQLTRLMASNCYFSHAKATRLLGYKPLWSYQQGVRLTVQAFRKLRNPDAPKDATPVNENDLPEYTAAEVATHTTDDDAWLIIDGKVYDVSDYVLSHPGGDAIMNNVGHDVSEGFHGPQHPKSVHDTVKAFLIGRLKA